MAGDQAIEGFAGERVFNGRVPVKYVLEKADRPEAPLVVVFSGARKRGEAPRYNWYRLLQGCDCHRLYLLDVVGAGDPEGPAWYLGPARGTEVPESVAELLRAAAREVGVPRERVVTAGSSMGGWAAIYYGALVGVGHVVAGEPQIRLGDYLSGPAFHEIAEHLAGGSGPEDQEFLNRLVFDAVCAAAPVPEIHLCCGAESPYREAHIAPLVELLDQLGASWELELIEGQDHGTIRKWFALFLVERLKRLGVNVPEGARQEPTASSA
jgi:pimeloyl-ACP methyl ester carboxylesterase